MATPLSIIIIEKTGELKSLSVKDFKEEELYKKCGFKKADGFEKVTEWSVKFESKKHLISLYAKSDGRANNENKYDFPPPVDNTLFFGSCALVLKVKNESKDVLTNLTLDLWNKLYEKLFGGFEDLAANAKEDEEEEDELDKVPDKKKTKHGYLKDGFVVESDNEDYDESSENENSSSSEECEEYSEEDESDLQVEDIDDTADEIAEEVYDYTGLKPNKIK
jgi:hypothetical protein